MNIESLDHINIRTSAFNDTVLFYEQVLGLDRSPGSSSQERRHNAWLAIRGGPVLIHVNGLEPGEEQPSTACSSLNHFALRCINEEACMEHLLSLGVDFQQRRLADGVTKQIILYDPNNIKIELVFADGIPS